MGTKRIEAAAQYGSDSAGVVIFDPDGRTAVRPISLAAASTMRHAAVADRCSRSEGEAWRDTGTVARWAQAAACATIYLLPYPARWRRIS
jgi:hypothetical protein